MMSSIEKIDTLILFTEKRDTLSSAQGTSHPPLYREEKHSIFCKEKEYGILSIEKRETLSSVTKMSVDSPSGGFGQTGQTSIAYLGKEKT